MLTRGFLRLRFCIHLVLGSSHIVGFLREGIGLGIILLLLANVGGANLASGLLRIHDGGAGIGICTIVTFNAGVRVGRAPVVIHRTVGCNRLLRQTRILPCKVSIRESASFLRGILLEPVMGHIEVVPVF